MYVAEERRSESEICRFEKGEYLVYGRTVNRVHLFKRSEWGSDINTLLMVLSASANE